CYLCNRADDGIRDWSVTGVQTCALPIFVVLHTSTPSFKMDVRTAEMIKAENPQCVIAFVGGHATAIPDQTLKASAAIDIAARKEFDWSMKEVAEGWDWSKILGISYRKDDKIYHNLDRT